MRLCQENANCVLKNGEKAVYQSDGHGNSETQYLVDVTYCFQAAMSEQYGMIILKGNRPLVILREQAIEEEGEYCLSV